MLSLLLETLPPLGPSPPCMHLLEHIPGGVGGCSGGRAGGGQGSGILPLRRTVVRFVCLWQWLGKGFHALQGVDVKWCPRAGHGALSVGPALDWARSSRELGSLLGTPLGASRPSPLAQLPRAFLGGSQWAHLPHIGCDPCLALCPLGLFPLLGAGPLTPQREDPVRGSCGHGSWCRQCVWGAGDWDRGLGVGGWGGGASRLSPWLHV